MSQRSTCINDYSHGLFRVADGAASQQQVFFVKCISSAAAMDSVRSEDVQTFLKVLIQNVSKQRQNMIMALH